MSKQHSTVDSNYHRYALSGLITQSEKQLQLNGLGMSRVVDNAIQEYLVTNYYISQNLQLKFSDYGDMWIETGAASYEAVITDLPLKHNIVVLSQSFALVILYSHIYENFRISLIKRTPVTGTYRVSVYPNNIYFPIQYGCICLLAIESTLEDDGEICTMSASTDIQFTESGFYINDLESGYFYRETSDEFTVTFQSKDFVYCPFIVSNGVEYRGEVKKHLKS